MKKDWPLLQIHRQLGKDESIAALFAKIKELEFENGQLKSEIAHLESELSKKPETPKLPKLNKEDKEDLKKEYLRQYGQHKVEEIKALRAKNRRLRNEKNEWRNKFIQSQIK